MAKKGKGKKKNKSQHKVIAGQPQQIPIRFSFRYYDDRQNAPYCLSQWGEQHTREALHRLKELSEKTYLELKRDSQSGKGLRVHTVNWADTKEPDGFPSRQLDAMENVQVKLLGINDGMARVFGGYYKNTFYLVWFDKNHEIYGK